MFHSVKDSSDNIVVRGLSPNSHKIEIEGDTSTVLDTKMLQQMGHELANIHLGTGNRRTSNQEGFRWPKERRVA